MNKPETGSAKDTAETSGGKPGESLKRIKHGSMSLITIALVIVIVVLVNIMASYMVKRTPLQIDLTADNRYELSDETISYLKDTLAQDVEIVVTCPRDEFAQLGYQMEAYYRQYGYDIEFPYNMIPIILDRYEMYANQGSGSISVKYVDLQNDPKALSKYEQYYDGTFAAESIVVYSNETVRVIETADVVDMLTWDQSNTTVPTLLFAGESRLTSEIMNVTDAHPIKVALVNAVNGTVICDPNRYNDAYFSLRDELLSKNGYFCTEIDLATDELSPDVYDMVVIPMPCIDFDEPVINKLSDFLYNNEKYDRNVVYIDDVVTTGLTNINEFLRDWSIDIEEGSILYDEENYMGVNPLTVTVGTDESSEEFGGVYTGTLSAVAPYSSNVKIVSKNSESVANALLVTKNTTQSVDITNGDVIEDASVKNSAVISKREFAHQFDVYRSNLIVFGSGLMFGSDFIVQTKLYSNANVLLGILNSVTGKEAGVVIPEKTLQKATIAPTASQDKTIKIVVIYVIPLAVAAVGLFILLRRRNK